MSDIEKTRTAIRTARTALTEGGFILNTARDKYTEAQGSITAALDVIERLAAAMVALTANSEQVDTANNQAIQHAEDAVVNLVRLGLDTPTSPSSGKDLLKYASAALGHAQFTKELLSDMHEITEQRNPSDFQAMKDAVGFVAPCLASGIEEAANIQQHTLDAVETATSHLENL